MVDCTVLTSGEIHGVLGVGVDQVQLLRRQEGRHLRQGGGGGGVAGGDQSHSYLVQ